MPLTKVPFKVALVEDQQQFRERIEREFAVAPEEFSLVCFSSAEEFLRMYEKGAFDLVLVDLILRDMGGVDLIRTLAGKYQEFKCVVVSTILSENQILEVLKAGAIGYLQKLEIQDLLGSIRIFKEGGSVISPSIAAKILPSFRNNVPPGWEKLSPRESQVLKELTNGYSPEEIAETFQLSLYTVRTQIRNIYRKLQVNSRFQLMKKLSEQQ